MPVISSDRPISALHEEAIDQLIINYAHGKLSLAAFEPRLDQALQAETHEVLETLTADLESFPQHAFSEDRKREAGIRMETRGGQAFERFVNVFSGTNKKGPWTVAKRVEIDSSPASTDANAPTLTVEGFMLFSGLQIKIKRTLKERLQDFAASVRAMFGTTRPV